MQITWVKPPKGGFILNEYTMEKKKVIVYVDGYNFYYGLKHGGRRWKRLYWLDVVKFFERMMLPDDVTFANGHVLHRPDNWR